MLTRRPVRPPSSLPIYVLCGCVLTFCQWATLRERRVPSSPPRERIHAAQLSTDICTLWLCTHVLPVGDSEREEGATVPSPGVDSHRPVRPPSSLPIYVLCGCTHVLPVGDSEREEGAAVPSPGADSRRPALYQYMYSVVVLTFCQWATLRERRVPPSLPWERIHAALSARPALYQYM